MRQDPDVILIGEIRDNETAQACLKAAETGHLVISTIHSMTATAAISRLLDLSESEQAGGARSRLAEILRGIVVQKLVRSTAEDGQLVPVNEILLNTDEVKQMIEKGEDISLIRNLIETGRDVGMQTFEQDFQQLVEAGIVTEQVALAQATNPTQMRELLTGLKSNTEEASPSPMKNMMPTRPNSPVEKSAAPKKFSEIVKEKEVESGIVVKPSSAAPNKLPKPIRPNIYTPLR